jgi:hypothetical protein
MVKELFKAWLYCLFQFEFQQRCCNAGFVRSADNFASSALFYSLCAKKICNLHVFLMPGTFLKVLKSSAAKTYSKFLKVMEGSPLV